MTYAGVGKYSNKYREENFNGSSDRSKRDHRKSQVGQKKKNLKEK